MLLREGTLTKAKSRRKLRAFLMNDILVLTDDGANNLYRMVSLCQCFWIYIYSTQATAYAFEPTADRGSGQWSR